MQPRRDFLTGVGTAAAFSTMARQSSGGQLRAVRVGVMGLSRGQSLANDLAGMPDVSVSWVCDVDDRRMDASRDALEKKFGTAPNTTRDFRDMLADDQIDALVCAAPNHWHGPATIMACKAGKHVYVEKPCSHNPQEGEWMVEAAEKYGRAVQMGTQRRSAAGTQAAMKALHTGAIGEVLSARCYYTNLRTSIGTGVEQDPPEHVDFGLWQGPAPKRPYKDNIVPYNWHWLWHYGGGELANNGVHALDLCRWGLGVDYPSLVTSSGGRYWFDDDQETPDAQTACFEFEGGKRMTWQAHSCNKHGVNAFCEFFGTKGSLELDSDGKHRIYNRDDKLVHEGEESSVGQREHLQNFVDVIRNGRVKDLNQPILEGHKSTLLCHLGNIAYRTQQTLKCDPTSGKILGDTDAMNLWRRDYNPDWLEDVTEI